MNISGDSSNNLGSIFQLDSYTSSEEEISSSIEETAPTPPEETTKNKILLNKCVNISKSLYQPRLSLQDAQNYLMKIKGNIVIHNLNILNLQFINLVSIIKKLSLTPAILICQGITYQNQQDEIIRETSGKLILQKLAPKIHSIFENFRQYKLLLYGKISSTVSKNHLVLALMDFAKIVELYNELIYLCSDIPEAKPLFHELQLHMDIIYYLCHDEDFLSECLDSMSPGKSTVETVLNWSPDASYYNFYLKSTEALKYGILLFEAAIKEEYFDTIDIQLGKMVIPPKLSTELDLNSLINDLENFKKALKLEILITPLRQMTSSPNHDKILALFNSLKINGHIPVFDELYSHLTSVSTPWESYFANLDSQFQKNTVNLVAVRQKVVNHINSLKTILSKNRSLKPQARNQLIQTLEGISSCVLSKKYIDQLNVLIITPARNSYFISFEMRIFFTEFKSYENKFKCFKQNLLANSPHSPPCSPFFAIDVLINQWAPRLIEKDENMGFLIVKDTLTIISNCIIAIQCRHSFIKVNNSDQIDRLVKSLKSLCKKSLPYFKDDPFEATLITLEDYLSQSTYINARYIYKYLDSPITDQEIINKENVTTIKEFFLLFSTSLNFFETDESFSTLEYEIKQKLLNCQKNATFYWKLNFNNIKLYRIQTDLSKKLIQHYAGLVQKISTPDELITLLHQWRKEYKKILVNIDAGACKAINLLSRLSLKENFIQIQDSVEVLSKWEGIFNFFSHTFVELTITNPLPTTSAKEVFKKIETADAKVPELTIEGEEQALTLTQALEPIFPQQEHVAPYSKQSDLINLLKTIDLRPLSKSETIESYFFRVIKRPESVDNIFFFMTLLEEEHNNDEDCIPQLLKLRKQIDEALLMESTQQTALFSLPLCDSKDHPNTHVSSVLVKNKPFIYSHDGEMFVRTLHEGKFYWFNEEQLRPAILSQKNLLKKSFWFQNDFLRVSSIPVVRSACENVWQQLATFPSSRARPSTLQALEYSRSKKHLDKIKRKRAIEHSFPIFACNLKNFKQNLDLLLNSNKYDSQCSKLVQNNVRAMHRVLDLHESLASYPKSELMPLFFCMRSAEVQVNILSLALQLALSTHFVDADVKHPLFLDQDQQDQGRPLHHTHKPEKLFAILKNLKGNAFNNEILLLLEKYLSQYRGDPRYPYPNKSFLTNDLVKTHQKIHLVQKIHEGGFFSNKELQMLKRFVGAEGKDKPLNIQEKILRRGLEAMIKKQKEKTAFAFYLAESLIESL